MVCACNMVENSDKKLRETLERCHRNGWLHADIVNRARETIGYTFPTRLHQWFVEWKLAGFNNAIPTQTTLLQFSIEAIRLFSPLNLSSERRIGAGFIQRPPEAQYQDEFYRCCYKLSKGLTTFFPEFGGKKGRVDFYIPSMQWGVELLRDGNALAEHCGRFSTAGKYMTTLQIADYIVLDFRDAIVTEKHPSSSAILSIDSFPSHL
jgi:hypothetical protein